MMIKYINFNEVNVFITAAFKRHLKLSTFPDFVRACERACVRACVRMYVCMYEWLLAVERDSRCKWINWMTCLAGSLINNSTRTYPTLVILVNSADASHTSQIRFPLMLPFDLYIETAGYILQKHQLQDMQSTLSIFIQCHRRRPDRFNKINTPSCYEETRLSLKYNTNTDTLKVLPSVLIALSTHHA